VDNLPATKGIQKKIGLSEAVDQFQAEEYFNFSTQYSQDDLA